MEKGVPIRAISRSIAVMQAINRHGSLTLMQIAQEAALAYPTTCRIVQTLQFEGLIEREPDRKRYRPTALVHTLSHGFQTDERLVTAARPHIVELTRKLSWPVTVATRVGQRMMVRDSTHGLTSLTFNKYHPGYTLPILECATGRAYLAWCDEDERAMVLEGLRSLDIADVPGADALPLFENGLLPREVRAQGFATRHRNPYTETPGKTSSIAVPIFDDDQLVGTMTIVFFSIAMKMEQAVETLLPDLKRCADAISRDLGRRRVAA
jgi:IclR family mhp operon transcriptional activator